MMEGLSLVTGAAGHLGNTLVRELLAKGRRVRAGVRNLDASEALAGLECEAAYADLLDKGSLLKALEGVDTLYQVAAVFKHWAPNPMQDIVQANLTMTRNILEAAAERGVKKIVYVSSIAALDRNVVPLQETTWNKDFRNPYFHAKTVAEQLAWELAQKMNLAMVTVLPSAIIGPNLFGHLTPTMSFFKNVVDNRLPFDPEFNFNYVYVSDVAAGMTDAAEKGRNGERYILATEPAVSVHQVFEIAQSLFPGVTIPRPISYEAQLEIADRQEKESRVTGQPPALLRANIELSYRADVRIDISKARRELGYDTISPEAAIRRTFQYLKGVVK